MFWPMVWLGVIGRPGTSAARITAATYSLNGRPANLRLARRIAPETDAYTLTGAATGFYKPEYLESASGSLTLTGQDSGFVYLRVLKANQATFVYDGRAAGLITEAGVEAMLWGAGNPLTWGGDPMLWGEAA